MRVAASRDIGSGQTSVANDGSRVPVVEQSETRVSVLIVNEGTVDVYIGDESVGPNSFKLLAGAGIELRTSAGVFAHVPTTAAGAGALHWLAEFV